MASENKLTITGQKWVNTLHKEKGITRPDNPFLFIDDTLYMRYDGIRIKNLSRVDGKGVEAGYYYKGQKVCIFPVMGISIVPDPDKLADVLSLDGMAGTMKMVLVDN